MAPIAMSAGWEPLKEKLNGSPGAGGKHLVVVHELFHDLSAKFIDRVGLNLRKSSLFCAGELKALILSSFAWIG